MTENGFTRARAQLDAAGASVGFVLVALSQEAIARIRAVIEQYDTFSPVAN